MSRSPMTAAKPSILNNSRGLATIEAVPLLVIFVMLTGYCMGLFGATHTAILQSIAARTYAFETFRNRTNLVLHRDTGAEPLSNRELGIRYHTVVAENAPTSTGSVLFYAAKRPLAMGFTGPDTTGNRADHLERIYEIQPRNDRVGVSPMWIMVGYGMCLNAECGGGP